MEEKQQQIYCPYCRKMEPVNQVCDFRNGSFADAILNENPNEDNKNYGTSSVYQMMGLPQFEKKNRDKVEVKEQVGIDDTGLLLLVDYTCRLAKNDYYEIALYKNEQNDSYQVHTYLKSAGKHQEVHQAYYGSEQLKLEVFQLLKNERLLRYNSDSGSIYTLQYENNGKFITISDDSQDSAITKAMLKVAQQLDSVIVEGNELKK